MHVAIFFSHLFWYIGGFCSNKIPHNVCVLKWKYIPVSTAFDCHRAQWQTSNLNQIPFSHCIRCLNSCLIWFSVWYFVVQCFSSCWCCCCSCFYCSQQLYCTNEWVYWRHMHVHSNMYAHSQSLSHSSRDAFSAVIWIIV